jgi:hypothetical protein
MYQAEPECIFIVGVAGGWIFYMSGVLVELRERWARLVIISNPLLTLD